MIKRKSVLILVAKKIRKMPQPLAVTAFMASPGRFELPAPRLGGVCSIQLSYGDIFDFSWSRMERSASQDFDDLIIRRRVLYPAELLRQVTVAIIPVFRPDCKCPLQFCARFLILQDGHEPLHGLRLRGNRTF